jgi:hypothetical protein
MLLYEGTPHLIKRGIHIVVLEVQEPITVLQFYHHNE